ncbi:MAG: pentapeptide repeat-containing protein [Okeania sp. SIO3H1]|nr:pentapeptide repeat-containing protein [Okeania sp. SIO3H1]NET29172.1 pentapeptide repeat-containing protein [Okeania sp. SIO1I7]
MEVNFQGANFTNTDLSWVNFSQIKLINLTGVIFDGANLKNANLSGLNLS